MSCVFAAIILRGPGLEKRDLSLTVNVRPSLIQRGSRPGFFPILECIASALKGNLVWNFVWSEPTDLERIVGGDGRARHDLGAVKNVQGVFAGVLVDVDVRAGLRDQSHLHPEFFSGLTDGRSFWQFAGFAKSARNIPPALFGFDAAAHQQNPSSSIADQDAGGRFGVAPGGLAASITVRVRAGTVIVQARAAVVTVTNGWHRLDFTVFWGFGSLGFLAVVRAGFVVLGHGWWQCVSGWCSIVF